MKVEGQTANLTRYLGMGRDRVGWCLRSTRLGRFWSGAARLEPEAWSTPTTVHRQDVPMSRPPVLLRSPPPQPSKTACDLKGDKHLFIFYAKIFKTVTIYEPHFATMAVVVRERNFLLSFINLINFFRTSFLPL